MEYIKGKKLFDWVLSEEFLSVTPKQLYFFIKELYKQCLALDSVGLSHNQLQVGKNILVTRKNIKGEDTFSPVIIDFEKSSLKESARCKNSGQIFAMLFFNPNGAIAKRVREKLGIEI